MCPLAYSWYPKDYWGKPGSVCHLRSHLLQYSWIPGNVLAKMRNLYTLAAKIADLECVVKANPVSDLVGEVSPVVEHDVGSPSEDFSSHRYTIVLGCHSVVPGERAISEGVVYSAEARNHGI
jgi:hypothetical protein